MLLLLKLDYLSQLGEVTGPGRNRLVVEVVLGDNNLLLEVPFVMALHLFKAEKTNGGQMREKFIDTYFCSLNIDL